MNWRNSIQGANPSSAKMYRGSIKKNEKMAAETMPPFFHATIFQLSHIDNP